MSIGRALESVRFNGAQFERNTKAQGEKRTRGYVAVVVVVVDVVVLFVPQSAPTLYRAFTLTTLKTERHFKVKKIQKRFRS